MGTEEETSTPPPGAEAEAAPMGAAAAGPPVDDDDTRGIHLRRLAGHPVTLSLTITLVIAAFVVGTITSGAALGGAVAGGVLLLAIIIVFAIANARAKEDFYNAFAQARGLDACGPGTGATDHAPAPARRRPLRGAAVQGHIARR